MVQEFTDLHAWKAAHKLTIATYKLISNLPSSEKYGLIPQMRRSSVSIGSNIAEGFGRTGQKEKLQFYSFARGSAFELLNQLYVCRDLGFIEENSFKRVQTLSYDTIRLIQGLIRSTRNQT